MNHCFSPACPSTPQRASLILALLLLCAAPVSAQTSGEKTADWISTGLVGVNMVADGIYSVQHHCLTSFLLKNGLVVGVSELGKHFVHKERPNHYDFKSWPSEHSALAMANGGWNVRIGFTVAVGAGAGRVISQFHDPLDVLSGFVIGWGGRYLFPCEGR